MVGGFSVADKSRPAVNVRAMLSDRWISMLGSVGCTAILVSCGSVSPAKPGKDPKLAAWDAAAGEFRSGEFKPTKSLAGNPVPALASPTLEKKWGKPQIERKSDGSYSVRYASSRRSVENVEILGMTKPLPPLDQPPPTSSLGYDPVKKEGAIEYTPQAWRVSSVEGQPVRWFVASGADGADGASYVSEGFSLRSADGRIGYYQLRAESEEADTATIARWFESVKTSRL